MLKFSPCIEMMFREVDFYDRFAKAKQAGVNCVEFWGWGGKDLNLLEQQSKANDIRITSICVDSIEPATAEVFNAKRLLYRDGIDAFVSAVKESITVAKRLNVPSLIVTTGDARIDATHYEQHTIVVLALRKAAPYLEDAGIQLIIEPLNVLENHMGNFLPSSYEAFGICEEVASPNVKVLYDIYHQQISEGNLIPTIRKYFPWIGHFHVADVPGRHEPGTGEINYLNVFKEIEKLGYDKYVGLEYSPTGDSAESIQKVLNMVK